MGIRCLDASNGMWVGCDVNIGGALRWPASEALFLYEVLEEGWTSRGKCGTTCPPPGMIGFRVGHSWCWYLGYRLPH